MYDFALHTRRKGRLRPSSRPGGHIQTIGMKSDTHTTSSATSIEKSSRVPHYEEIQGKILRGRNTKES